MSIATPLAATAAPAAARSLRPVALWIFVCAAMVFAMVVIGGITRLTESGLSIVEWKPLIGAIPPLSEADWQALFAKYQTSPQYHQVNRSMTVDEFKTIFWWEYIHRLWGRLIGAVFLLPFLWFLARGHLRGGLAVRLGGIFGLGGLQGAMGWYMVASGLVDRPEVSQYRLVAHLGLAVLIYALLFWQGLRLWRASSESPLPLAPSLEGKGDKKTLRHGATILLALIALTMLAGGFVAGLDAGMIYNTFPLMEGRLVPPDYGLMQPWWHDWFENRATVQFHHRVLAIATLAAILVYAWRARPATQPTAIRRAAIATVHLALVQVVLGIATLLLVVPVSLGAAHQAGAMALLTSALWLRFELRR